MGETDCASSGLLNFFACDSIRNVSITLLFSFSKSSSFCDRRILNVSVNMALTTESMLSLVHDLVFGLSTAFGCFVSNNRNVKLKLLARRSRRTIQRYCALTSAQMAAGSRSDPVILRIFASLDLTVSCLPLSRGISPEMSRATEPVTCCVSFFFFGCVQYD